MKLVTWNIQWGLGTDGRVDLARIVAHARTLADFDVLCLQEVSDGMSDLAGCDGRDQFAAVAVLLPGFRAVAGAGLEIAGPDGAIRRFGNMTLSRLPVCQVLRHQLPWPGGGAQSMPRTLLETTVISAFGPLRVLNTHLEYSSAAARTAQVEAIRAVQAAACDREDRPRGTGAGPYDVQPGTRAAILLGDLNMKPEDPTLRRLSEPAGKGVPAFVDAWPALHGGVPHPPSFCIADQRYGPPHCSDYAFVTADLRSRLQRVAYDTDTRLSDHQPVVLELDHMA